MREFITVRDSDGHTHDVPVNPLAVFPDNYEVTFEARKNDGGMHRKWTLKPTPPQTHGIIAVPETE